MTEIASPPGWEVFLDLMLLPRLFDDWSAADFYRPAGVNRATQRRFRVLKHTHCTLARACPAYNLGDPRWDAALESALARVIARYTPYRDGPSRQMAGLDGAKLHFLNLKGLVVPRTLELLRETSHSSVSLTFPNLTKLQLGMIAGDTTLVFGAQRLPLWYASRSHPYLGAYIFKPALLTAVDDQDPDEMDDDRYLLRNPVTVPVDFGGHLIVDDELEAAGSMRNVVRPPLDNSIHVLDTVNRNTSVLVFDFDERGTLNFRDGVPFEPRHKEGLKHLTLISCFPADYDDVDTALISAQFVVDFLETNPQLEAVTLMQRNKSAFLLMTLDPVTDEEDAFLESLRSTPRSRFLVLGGLTRDHFEGDRIKHAELLGIWLKITNFFYKKPHKRFSIMFDDDTSQFYTYGGRMWPERYALPTGGVMEAV